jgi:hypothetical protein
LCERQRNLFPDLIKEDGNIFLLFGIHFCRFYGRAGSLDRYVCTYTLGPFFGEKNPQKQCFDYFVHELLLLFCN